MYKTINKDENARNCEIQGTACELNRRAAKHLLFWRADMKTLFEVVNIHDTQLLTVFLLAGREAKYG